MLNKGPERPGFGLGLKPWHCTTSSDTGARSLGVDCAWQEPGEVSSTSRDTGPRILGMDCARQEPVEVMNLDIDPERSWIRLLAIG